MEQTSRYTWKIMVMDRQMSGNSLKRKRSCSKICSLVTSQGIGNREMKDIKLLKNNERKSSPFHQCLGPLSSPVVDGVRPRYVFKIMPTVTRATVDDECWDVCRRVSWHSQFSDQKLRKERLTATCQGFTILFCSSRYFFSFDYKSLRVTSRPGNKVYNLEFFFSFLLSFHHS